MVGLRRKPPKTGGVYLRDSEMLLFERTGVIYRIEGKGMRPRNKLEMFEAKHRTGAMESKEVSEGQCGKHGSSSSFICCCLCVVEQNENVRGAGRTPFPASTTTCFHVCYPLLARD